MQRLFDWCLWSSLIRYDALFYFFVRFKLKRTLFIYRLWYNDYVICFKNIHGKAKSLWQVDHKLLDQSRFALCHWCQILSYNTWLSTQLFMNAVILSLGFRIQWRLDESFILSATLYNTCQSATMHARWHASCTVDQVINIITEPAMVATGRLIRTRSFKKRQRSSCCHLQHLLTWHFSRAWRTTGSSVVCMSWTPIWNTHSSNSHGYETKKEKQVIYRS